MMTGPRALVTKQALTDLQQEMVRLCFSTVSRIVRLDDGESR